MNWSIPSTVEFTSSFAKIGTFVSFSNKFLQIQHDKLIFGHGL